jgi:multidrug efflux pump subunit AcrA (membrane-fusion protein)
MRRLAVLLSGAWLGLAFWTSSSVSAESAAETVRLPDCVISCEDEVLVPAQEAGALKELPVKDGQHVKKGDLLAQIDDMIPQAQVEVAKAKLQAAQAEATSDIALRYATAAAATAKADYEQNREANDRYAGTIPQARLRELLLKAREMELTIEKAEKDHVVATHQAQVAVAELRAAEANRDHRRVSSPLEGEVVELSRHAGEWVQAGDPLMRVVRLDKLRVEGSVSAKDYLPSELQDRPVTVTVELAHGKKETFPGKVVLAKPVVATGGEYQIRAEVENRKDNGAWVLRPGLLAEMTIQLK